MDEPDLQRPTVSPAGPADAGLLARLARKTFPGNFVGRMPPAGMQSYIDTAFSADQIATEMGEEGSTFFLAVVGEHPAGYARLRMAPAPPEVFVSPAAEIQRLYVVEEHWGAGVGRALAEACFDRARQQGCTAVWLGTWSENPRAIGFYTALGFEPVGTKTFVLGDEIHLDLVMTRRL